MIKSIAFIKEPKLVVKCTVLSRLPSVLPRTPVRSAYLWMSRGNKDEKGKGKSAYSTCCLAAGYRGTPSPSLEVIQTAVRDGYYDTDNFSPGDFARLDEQPDDVFYSSPRLVEHIAPPTVQVLTSYHDQLINKMLERFHQIKVLDLCSSWVSHVSPSLVLSADSHVQVVGLGMNADELRQNSVLSDYTIRDLNAFPQLPYADNSMQLVLLQLSIDYLTHPVEVLREVRRALQPDGQLAISFSNRLFLTKVVGAWASRSDEDRIALVSHYLKDAHFDLANIQALSLPNSGDPLYIVTATK
eukprot:gene27509-33228_t